MLTAARSGEVRLATWDEIDTAGAVWTVPATRMKAKREHRVRLCRRALEILEAAPSIGDGNRLVFPMRSGRSISTPTFPRMLRYREVAAVPHGFPSSFRDWAAEERIIRVKSLRPRSPMWSRTRSKRHTPGSELFDRRRRLINDWAVYLAGPSRAAGQTSLRIGPRTL